MRAQEWVLGIWGSLELVGRDGRVTVRRRERAVLAALVVHRASGSSVDEIAELVWGDSVPNTYRKSIQNHVARIRSAAPGVVETTPTGYRLSDAVRIDPASASDAAEPLSDLADTVEVAVLRQSLISDRDDAWVEEMGRRLDAGSGSAVVGEIERWMATRVDHSAGTRLLVRALAASNRPADALAVIRDANRQSALAGRPPDRTLRDLERRILDDDPMLRGSQPRPDQNRSVTGHAVGITAHLERIERVVASPSDSFVVVTGPAGIGKTTLVEQFREQSSRRGELVLIAGCSPEPLLPLEPFVEVLDQLGRRFAPAMAEVEGIELLAPLLPELVSSLSVRPRAQSSDRSELFAVVAAALSCAPRPVTIVLEDFHWATRLTRRALRAVLDGLSGGSPTVLVTSREASTDLVEPAAAHVELQPLGVEHIEEYLARSGRPDEWCAGAAEWIHRQSGGVALYVRELSTEAQTTAMSESFDAPTVTSTNLLASLERTIMAVSSATRRDLSAAAVLGRRFRGEEWTAMGEGIEASRREAVDAGIIEDVAADELAFRHDLFHQIVLDAISPGRRVELHDMALRAVVDRGVSPMDGSRIDELCRYAVVASALDTARAIEFLRIGSVLDMGRFAYEAGIEKCRAALALLVPGTVDRDRVEFEIRLGELQLRTADAGAGEQLLTAARVALDLGDDDLVADALREACRLGPTSVVGAVHDEASRLLELAADTVRDDRAAAVVATAGVMLYAISRENDRCRVCFERAVAYDGDAATRVDALSLAVLVLTERTDVERRADIEQDLRVLAHEVGTPEALWGAAHLRMTNQVQAGDPDMRVTLRELGELTVSLRQRSRLWEFTNWSASVALTDGDPVRAESLATDALACADAVAESLVMSAYGAQLFAIRHAQGRVGEMFEMVEAIVDSGDAIGAWHAVLALAAAESDHQAVARKHLDVFVDDDFALSDRGYTFNGALFAAASAACRIADVDSAGIIEREMEQWSGFWAFVGSCTMGPIDTALAQLAELRGDSAAALGLARSALRSAQRAEAPIYIAQAEGLIERLELELEV